MAGSGGGAGTKQRAVSAGEDASRAAIDKMYKIYEQLNSAEDKSLVRLKYAFLNIMIWELVNYW